MDQATIVDVRFPVSKEFWLGYPFYDRLDDRVYGTFKRWINTSELMPKILWDDGGEDTQVGLADLLAEGINLRFEVYADGRSAPKASEPAAAGEGGTCCCSSTLAAR